MTKLTFKFMLTLSITLFVNATNAQIIIKSGSIFDEVSTFIANIPGASGNNYQDPTASQFNNWGVMLADLLNNDYTNAGIKANALGYDLIEFTDTGKPYYILKTKTSNHWGLFIYNPNYCREVVIQCPHPIFDFNTGKQGIHVFKETNSLFYFVSGTHRCNNAEASSCSGTTTVCSGTSESFKISDLAHNEASILQKTTEVLLNKYNDSFFIQLHGFGKQTTDPFVIASNGTQITPPIDYLSTFTDKLFIEDNSLTFKIGHIDTSWTRLMGTTNTQGRLVNGSLDACNTAATSCNGRFLHVEQEKTKLRDNITGWTKVSNAIANTFNCNGTNPPKNCLNTNGDFSSGVVNWSNGYTDTGVTANFAVTNGEMAVTNIAGALGNWSVLLEHYFNFENGVNYTISFDARADIDGIIAVGTREGNSPVAPENYMQKTIGTAMTNFTLTYTHVSNTYTNGQILFYLGNFGNVYLDNLCVSKEPTMDTTENRLNSKDTFRIYPNPATSVLHLNLPESGIIDIFSIDGKVLISKKINTVGSNELNIKNLNSGIYLCRYTNSKESKTLKLVKQ